MNKKYIVHFILVFLMLAAILTATFTGHVSLAEYLISASLGLLIIALFIYDNAKNNFLSIYVFAGCCCCFAYQIIMIIDK